MSVAASISRASIGSEEVEVSGRGRGIRVIDLPAVFTTPEEREMLYVITAFDLSRNELEELANLQPLRSLTRLNASYNRIHRCEALPLQLTQLNLSHNKLEHLDSLGTLVHLRELNVSFNRLGSLAGLTPRMPLEVLNADDNCLQHTSGLEELHRLRVVSLSNNYVEDVQELYFAASAPQLTLLSLSGNPVTRARRYRQTLADLQPSLVSLDGSPLARPRVQPLERTGVPVAKVRGELEKKGLSEPSLVSSSSTAPSRVQTSSARTATAPVAAAPRKAPASSAMADVRAAPASVSAQADMRLSPPLMPSLEHRAVTTQTSSGAFDGSLEDPQTLQPRVDAPQPSTRVTVGTSTATPPHAHSAPSAAAVDGSGISPSVPSPDFSRGLAEGTRATTQAAALSSSGTLARPSKAGKQTKGVSPAPLARGRGPAGRGRGAATSSPPSAVRHGATATTTAPNSSSRSSARGRVTQPPTASPPSAHDVVEGLNDASVEEMAESAKDNASPARQMDAALTPLSSSSIPPPQQPPASQQQPRDGYAALHASSLSPTVYSRTPQHRGDSLNSTEHYSSVIRQGSPRILHSFFTPTSAQRSAVLTSSEMDLTSAAAAAQLHDSLVAKEQLEKECQLLRKRVRQTEGQLNDARRVISKQLSELSQLRLERDALRQSEGDLLEQLEKEKRSGKARASHHGEEVHTLQTQYERMKTFYEAQLADTRRELSTERTRLLQQQQQQSVLTTEAVEKKHSAGESTQPTSSTSKAAPRHTPRAAAVASPPLAGHPTSTAPMSSSAPPTMTPSPAAAVERCRQSSPALVRANNLASTSARTQEEGDEVLKTPYASPARSTLPEDISRQLSSWLYGGRRKEEETSSVTSAALPAATSATAAAPAMSATRQPLASHEASTSTNITAEAEDLRRSLLLAHGGSAPSTVKGGTKADGAAVEAAARRVLEEFLTQHQRSSLLNSTADLSSALRHGDAREGEEDGKHGSFDGRSASVAPPAAATKSEPSAVPHAEAELRDEEKQHRDTATAPEHVGALSEVQPAARVETRAAPPLPSALPLPPPLRQPSTGLPAPPSPPFSSTAETTFIEDEEDQTNGGESGRGSVASAPLSDDEEATVMLPMPPAVAARFAPDADDDDGDDDVAPSAVTRDARVDAAKALLKGMECLFEE